MEFTAGEFNVRLILNPTDFILRFEHSETHRIYERTFFERDFIDYLILGGLEFVARLLRAGIDASVGHSHVKNKTEFEVTPAEINIKVPFNNGYSSKALMVEFRVPAIRREKGGADIQDMSMRLKKMEEAMALCKTLYTRIEELEARCGDTITLPGCDYAIPVDVSQLILVLNNSMLPDGRRFSSWYPGMYHQHHYGWGEYTLTNPVTHPNQGTNPTWNLLPPHEKAYTFHKHLSLKNLKYLKRLTHLTICGSSESSKYETIGELQTLQELKIIPNMQSQQVNGQWQYTPRDSSPNLQNISWISNLKNLRSVSFQGCANLLDISAIKELSHLTELNVKNTQVKNTAFLINPKLTIHAS